MHHAIDPLSYEDSLHGEPRSRVRALGIPGFVKDIAGVGKGIGEGAVSTVSGIADAVANPVETGKGLSRLVTKPKETFPAMWRATKEPIEKDWKRGNPGEAIGRGLFGIVEVVAGTRGLSKLGKVGPTPPGSPGRLPHAPRPSERPKPPAGVPRRPSGGEPPPRGPGRGDSPRKPNFPRPVPDPTPPALVRDVFGKLDSVDAEFARRVDVQHIFRGGSGNGLHHAPGPGNHHGLQVREVANPDRPYVPGTTWRAKVTWPDGKSKQSTMFPREWSAAEVLRAIRGAEANAEWKGVRTSNASDPDIEFGVGEYRGIPIALQRNRSTGKIVTAYPQKTNVPFTAAGR